MSYINVQIDTCDLDTEDLIEIIEGRGFVVTAPGETNKDVEALQSTLDEIHNLYHSFIRWKDFDMKDSTFERDLKIFFDITIDKVVL